MGVHGCERVAVAARLVPLCCLAVPCSLPARPVVNLAPCRGHPPSPPPPPPPPGLLQPAHLQRPRRVAHGHAPAQCDHQHVSTGAPPRTWPWGRGGAPHPRMQRQHTCASGAGCSAQPSRGPQLTAAHTPCCRRPFLLPRPHPTHVCTTPRPRLARTSVPTRTTSPRGRLPPASTWAPTTTWALRPRTRTAPPRSSRA